MLAMSLREASLQDIDSYRLLLQRVRSNRSTQMSNRVAMCILDRLDSYDLRAYLVSEYKQLRGML
jgi:hypothetical protein